MTSVIEMHARQKGLAFSIDYRFPLPLEIETDPTSPERGQFKFVQALIREVAYSTLALRDRRSRHLAIARHYEALDEGEPKS